MLSLINKTITRQIIVLLISAFTIVLGVVGTVGYQLYSQSRWNELQANLELVANQQAASVALALWNLDHIQVSNILINSMQNRSVYAVNIQTPDNEYYLMRDENWDLVEANLLAMTEEDILQTHREIMFADQVIGSLDLAMTTRFLRQELNRILLALIGAIVFFDVFLIVLTYLLIYTRIIRPVKLLERYAQAVSSDDTRSAVDITRSLPGELDHLKHAFQKMVAMLESRLHELTETNDRFWRLVSGFPIALGIYQPSDGKVIFLNKKFTEMTGYTPDDVPDIATGFRHAFPDEARRQQMAAIWQSKIDAAIRNNGRMEGTQRTIVCKDGSHKTIDVASVLSGDYMMVLMNDITERIRAEDEIKAYQEHLEELVEIRTKELVEARDHAENANLAKSVFLANMSHELRTPLNSVIGFSQLMAMDPELSSVNKRNLEIINTSGTHLLTLINDILELSKIEAGKITLTPEPVFIYSLLNEVSDMLHQRAAESGLTLTVTCSDNMPAVLVDAAKLRQILINLTANAIKFTPKGNVTLSATHKQLYNVVQVDFSVTDTGIGISPENQLRIFEPFVQLNQGGERTGTGLGLAISRQYIQMLGGELTLRSVPGQGSTFSFSLVLSLNDDQDAYSGKFRANKTVSKAHAGTQVLLADDTRETRLLLCKVLDTMKLDVLVAEDGKQAWELFEKFHPPLLLLDWRMPEIDGIELTRRIRNTEAIEQPKIIMLTAYAFEDHRKEAFTAGADDFMSKPIDLSLLQKIIDKHLNLTPAADEIRIIDDLDDPLLADRVDSLSAGTRTIFQSALRELNPSKINEALDNIRTENPALADHIKAHTDAMQYRKLWQVFGILNNG